LQLSLNFPSLRLVNDSGPGCVPAGCPQPGLCPLNKVRAGAAVRIKQLCAAPDVSHRLREMGLGEEQQVRLVSKQKHVICQVCQSRVALSHDLAEAILVEPVSGQPSLVA
jgi:ferrous iron transport protein A